MIVPFKNSKASGMFVLPTRKPTKDDFELGKNSLGTYLKYSDSTGCTFFYIPAGDYDLLGKVSELTTEQMERVCERKYVPDELGRRYKDYSTGRYDKDLKDSFQSLLDSLQVYSVNPYGDKPKINGYNSHQKYNSDLEQWQAAEERTGNFILLIEKI